MSGLGFGSGATTTETERYLQAKDRVMGALKDYFRPEFLNRLDEIILFNILSPEHVRSIVQMQVDIVAKRLEDKSITLTFSEQALDMLAKEGYSVHYGARPLKRLIQTKILTPIANMIIDRTVVDGGAVVVDYAKEDFTFDIRKGPARNHSTRSRTKTLVGV